MKKYIYIGIAASLLIACGGNKEADPVLENDVVLTEETTERLEKAKLVFTTIPSPLETAMLFKQAGISYNPSITNPAENVRNYVTNVKKSLNLGVYGADLSFANMFDQSQESMFYMNCSKILADGLGVTSAFNTETIERLESNMNNRDSLIVLINDAFWITDAHLKDNGQHHISSLIIAGGWIEGLYLGVSSLDKENPNKAIIQRIAEQKYSLNNLVDLLDTYESEDLKTTSKNLKELQLVFNKIEVKEGKTTIENNNKVTTIGGGNELVYDPLIISEITTVIQKIRNEIIQ